MKTRSALKAAHQDKRLVRVRRGKGWAEHEGYVCGVGKHWFAVQTVQDAAPAALVFVRIQDVRKLTDPEHSKALAKRALKAYGQWPPQVPALLDLDDARSILFTGGSLAPVLSWAAEVRHPGVHFVGHVFRITRKVLTTQEISPKGAWRTDLTDYPLALITRVELHDPYVEGLRKIVGPPP